MTRARKEAAASSRLVPAVFRCLRAMGVDSDRLAPRVGLPREVERCDEASLTPEQFEQLLGLAATELDDPLLAARLPDAIEAPNYHIAELAARASATLREAFELVARYGSLFYAHLAFSCRDAEGGLMISQRLTSGQREGRYGNEFAVASTLSHARKIVGMPIAPQRVFFSHAPVPELGELARLFGTSTIAFGADENGLVFTAADAALPSVAKDPRLLATAEPLAKQALLAAPPAFDFIAAVEAKLRAGLPHGKVDAASVARAMKLSQRTLQRRVEEQGTSFSAIADRARKAAALAALRDPSLTLAAVAAAAGFADESAFSRAFKRWTGSAPGVYRRAQR